MGEKAGIQLCVSEFGGGRGFGEGGWDKDRAADGAHNDGYLSLCLCPPNCVSCLAVMELGTGGAVMANRGARRPLFCLMGRVGVGEAVNLREERGAGHRHARHVEMGRGVVCSHSVA